MTYRDSHVAIAACLEAEGAPPVGRPLPPVREPAAGIEVSARGLTG